MKWIPGLHLRVSEEAELAGLDIDQFFDEQVGDWGMFEELSRKREESILSPGTPLIQDSLQPSTEGAISAKKD